jgi:hypothetical protein
MSRGLALALIGIMLVVVIGQGVLLRGTQPAAVTEISLHDSRLVGFLHEIRADDPDTYDSILLNLTHLRDGPSQGRPVLLEEAVVAEQLLARLVGPAMAPAEAASPARR